VLIPSVTAFQPTGASRFYETDLPALQANTQTSAWFSCPDENQSRARDPCPPAPTRPQALAPERRRETLRAPYASVTPGCEDAIAARFTDNPREAHRSARHDRIDTISSRSSCAICLRLPARILGREKEHVDRISRLKKRLSKCGTRLMSPQ
jgi:hypothetical protein